MQNFVRNCFALLFLWVVLAGLAWVCGFTPDGLLYGNWPEVGDHPTNWLDTALHP